MIFFNPLKEVPAFNVLGLKKYIALNVSPTEDLGLAMFCSSGVQEMLEITASNISSCFLSTNTQGTKLFKEIVTEAFLWLVRSHAHNTLKRRTLNWILTTKDQVVVLIISAVNMGFGIKIHPVYLILCQKINIF